MKRNPPAPTPLVRPEDVPARIAELKAAMYGRLTPDAVGRAVERLADQAGAGDLRAIGMLLNVVAGAKSEGPTAEAVGPSASSPGVLRKLAARFLAANGAVGERVLAAQLEVNPADLPGLLNTDWFARDALGWTLTPAGRRAVG